MANDAYLRVSTHTQDVENQKLSVLDYCNSQGIAPIEFVEDTTSGRRSWRDREIGRLLETAAAGDVLVAAEVSRLARSTLQVLELLQAAAERGVTVHIAKHRMVLDQSLPATITATILGLAAQIEREFISARTKDVSDHRKTYFFGLSPTGHRSRQPRLWRGIGGNGSVQRLNRPQIEHRQRVGERRGAGELIVPPP